MKLPTKKTLPMFYAFICLGCGALSVISNGGWTPVSVFIVGSLYFGDKLSERNE